MSASLNGSHRELLPSHWREWFQYFKVGGVTAGQWAARLQFNWSKMKKPPVEAPARSHLKLVWDRKDRGHLKLISDNSKKQLMENYRLRFDSDDDGPSAA
jgi:hypothetical protein